jgi:hypothetical protein
MVKKEIVLMQCLGLWSTESRIVNGVRKKFIVGTDRVAE